MPELRHDERMFMNRRWDREFRATRARLLVCHDFAQLLRAGHPLRDGVVLTALGDTPFEMSFKCTLCDRVYWFENLAWRLGGIALWRMSEESRATAHEICVPPGYVIARVQGDRRGIMHP
jgi:hypothetical protein